LDSIDTASQVTSIKWSSEYRELVTSHGFPHNHLALWSYPSLAKIVDIPAHDTRVLHTAMSPDGQTIATAASDENLKFWRIFETRAKSDNLFVAMGRKSRSENLLNNLPQLQNLIKRDPHSYQEEFVQQLSHFEASLAIFELKPDEEAKEFGELINFLSQVAKCYPKKSTRFPKQLIDLLQKHYPVLNGDLRKSIVQALILLRSRGVVSNLRVMPLFFTLFRCRDKGLRKLLYTHIINDVKLANKGKHRNHKLNKALQGFMYTMITAADAQDKHGEGALAAKKSLDVCVELYRKNIWTDAKAVNVVAQACFSPITKVMMTAVQFFLNPQRRSGDNDESGSEAENDGSTKKKYVNMQMIQHQSNVNKKTKYRTRVMTRVARAHRREQAKKLGQLPASDDEDDDE
ncbi:Severe Depolymerization of Actin, partial [Coemansia sp. RSA 1694]